MSKKSVFAGVLLTGFFLASQAHAYTYWTCGGANVVWSDPFGMVQNHFSIAPGGTREVALDKAILRWQGVVGMQNMVFKSATFSNGPTIFPLNDRNDVAVVEPGTINGALGLTQMFHDGCFFGGDMEWIEADVVVANDLDFGKVEETALPLNSGRLSFIHEFGHAHGLGHYQSFNLMRGAPWPLVGGPGETIDVLPDDAQGGRFLYPTGNDEVNLFASAHRRTPTDKITTNNSGTVSFCKKGGTFTFNATVGNNGTVDVKQTERWWLSTSTTAYSGGIKIGQWNNGTFLANSVNTRELKFTVPALEPGTYFLYHGVDVLSEINESREDDNNVREALVIQVFNC
jgi:hypothetical protein